MGEVVKFRRPRKGTIRGAVREMVTEAMNTVGKPDAVVVIALAADGSFSLRTASREEISDFDMYSRAGALCDRERMKLIEMDP
jgi:hypothetical protein